jgi:transcriptional antiterminator RfaH
MNGSPLKWVVANTHPNKEKFAIENLHRQDFTSYCPMIVKRVKSAKRTRPNSYEDLIRPLFPGYVFVQVPSDRVLWRPILSTYGVRALIHFGAQIASIDQNFIQALKRREIDGVVSRPQNPFTVGDQVTIAGGPFDGVVATILSRDAKDRLVVLMDLLNRSVEVNIHTRQARATAVA